MNEDQLRDALQSQTPRRGPTDGSWEDVHDRAGHLHRRRRFAQSAVALVTVIAVLLGGLAIAGTFDDTTDRTVVAAPSGAEGEIVAALDHRIVVMTTDGDILRTIVDNVDLVGNISVSPDGNSVLFASRKSCQEGPRLQSVSLQTGTVTGLGLGGINALLSPDQKTLAFQAANPGCGGPNLGIGIRDASTGYADKGFIARATVPVGWSPDSRRLLYRANHAADAPDYVLSYDMDLEVSSRLATAVGAFEGSAAAFFPDGSLHGVLATVVNRSDLGYSVWDLDHTIPARFTAQGAEPDAMAADTSDRLLLHFADGTLQVQQGGDQPRTIATGVQGAAWLQSHDADVHGDLVVAFDHRIVVMTAEGNILRPIVENVDLLGGISVSPDGKYVYFAHAKPCEDGKGAFPGIARVALNGGSPSADIVNGVDPLVSPDGARIVGASEGCPVGDGSNSLFVVELSSGKASYAVSEGVAKRTPLAWAPDSSRFLYREEPVPDGATRILEYTSGNAFMGGATVSEVTAATYGANGVVSMSVATEGGYTVTQAPGDPPQGIAERYGANGARPSALSFAPDTDRLLVQLADGTLQIQQGSDQPRTIATGVQGAAWLPTAPPLTATSTTTTAPVSTTTTTAPGTHPASILAIVDNKVVELDAADGHVVREIANPPTAYGARLAVSPDGTTIYTTRQGPVRSDCPPPPFPYAIEVVAIDRATGVVTPVGTSFSTNAAVSPDGKLLAYLQTKCWSDQVQQLMVRDLQSGAERTLNLAGLPSGTAGGGKPGQILIWLSQFAPDSRHVLADVGGRTWSFDVGGSGSGAEIKVQAPHFSNQAYQGGTAQLVGTTEDSENRQALVQVDSTTGRVTQRLLDIPGGLGGITDVVTDASGRHFLLFAANRLFRWSVGESDVTPVIDVPTHSAVGPFSTAAAWLP